MADNLLHGSLAENVLTLLCFYDEEAGLVKNSVKPDLFESSVYQTIARAAIEYHDSYKQAPKEHLPDILENALKTDDSSLVALYDQTFKNLFDTADGINPSYVVKQLGHFVEVQDLKIGTVGAMKALQEGNLEDAKVFLEKSLHKQFDIFSPGLFLKNPADALGFLHQDDSKLPILTGIEYLDNHNICPAKGELFLILALANRGKTWAMIHLAKSALLQRNKVAHITLEMPEKDVMMRYIQSIFSISKREAETTIARLNKNSQGYLDSIDMEKLLRPGLDSAGIEDSLISKHAKLLGNKNLVVKQFPPRTLTVRGLEAYLDGLERISKFHPDMIVLDYADDMYINPQNFRIETSNLYKDLRRIAGERDIAMVTASQANRSAERAKIITMENFAEDFSKAHTADIVVTYNQNPLEKAQGIARLFTAKVRNDVSGKIMLITQNYQNGQFCLDSCKIRDDYYHTILSGFTQTEDDA